MAEVALESPMNLWWSELSLLVRCPQSQYRRSKFVGISSKISAGTRESEIDLFSRRQKAKHSLLPLQRRRQYRLYPRFPGLLGLGFFGLVCLPCPWTAAAMPALIAPTAAAPAKPPSTAAAVLDAPEFPLLRLNPDDPRPEPDQPELELPGTGVLCR